MTLEKLGVDTPDIPKDRKCPACRSKLEIRSGQAWCPKCGTEPFEKRRRVCGEEEKGGGEG